MKTTGSSVSSVSVTVHGAATLRSKQGPSSQPANTEPASASTLSVTALPSGKTSLQVGGQLMPLGELVTSPLPVPAGVIESVCPEAKIAVTDWLNDVRIAQVGLLP